MLFSSKSASKQKSTARARTKTRLGIETLEAREVYAVVGLTPLAPVLQNGILTVVGNDSPNTIDVTKSGSNINVLGKSFVASQVKQIVVTGEGGDDKITVSESITQKTYIYGGSGSDTIKGGGGVDVIYGGSSVDYIYGRGGDDSIYGGSGGDTIDGGLGNDGVYDAQSVDKVMSASTFISEDSGLAAYTSSSYAGQVVNEVLRLVNVARANAGKSAVKLDATLTYVASDYVKEMDRQDVPVGQGISHTFSGHVKPTLASRMDANLISYRSAGENNSYRLNTAGLAAKTLAYQFMYGTDGKGGLMNSAGHKANILGSSFTSIGLGLSGTTANGFYLTQLFKG